MLSDKLFYNRKRIKILKTFNDLTKTFNLMLNETNPIYFYSVEFQHIFNFNIFWYLIFSKKRKRQGKGLWKIGKLLLEYKCNLWSTIRSF